MKGSRVNLRKTFTALCTIVATVLTLTCQSPNSPDDLRKSISIDVGVSKAKAFSLEISTDGNGLVNPTGTVAVKEGIPFVLTAQPLGTHTFEEWAIVSQEGSVEISDPKATSTAVTLRGGAAKVMATFLAKPEVVYMTPTGNMIDRNTNVYAYFSFPIDPASVNAGNVRLLRNGVDDVDATLTVSQNFIKIDPSVNLDSYINYVVRIDKSVKDIAGRELAASGTSPFITGPNTDLTGPSSPSLTVGPMAGALYLTKAKSLLISNMSATDSAGVAAAELQLYDASFTTPVANTLQSFAFNSSASYTYVFDLLMADGKYYLGTRFVDVNGNKSTLDANTEHLVAVDTIKPNTPTIDVTGKYTGGSGKFYIGSADVSLAIANTDGAVFDAAYNNIAQMALFPSFKMSNSAPLIPFATSPSFQLASGDDGVRYVSVQTYDLAGNASTSAFTTIYLDTTPPTGSVAVASGALASSSTSVPLTLSAVDTLSGESSTTGLQYSKTGSDITNSAYAAFTATPTVVLTSGEGTKTIAIKVKDPVGNESTFSTSIILDTTAPSTPTFDINLGATQTTTSAVTLTNIVAPDNHLVKEMAFSNTPGFTPTPSDWTALTTTKAWTLIAGNGSRVVYMRSRDHAGNVSPETSASIMVDSVPASATLAISAGQSLTKLTAVTVNVTLSASVDHYELSNDNSTWQGPYTAASQAWTLTSSDGLKTVWLKPYNGAGIAGTSISDTITLDTTAPTGTLSLNAGYATTPSLKPNLTMTVTDLTSGLAAYQVRYAGSTLGVVTPWLTSPSASANVLTITSPIDIAAPYSSSQTYEVRVTDKAGNVSAWLGDTVTLEKPIVTNASKGFYAGNVYAYWSAIPTAGDATNLTYYYVYSVSSATQNPNVDTTDLVSHGGTTGLAKAVSSTPGVLRYYWVRAYDVDTGGWGPYIGTGTNPSTAFGALGFATSGATIIYNSANTVSVAAKDSVVGLLTNGPGTTPTSGTWTALQATVIDQSQVPTGYNYVSGANSSQVFGDPLIVMPGTTVTGVYWGNSTSGYGQAHNLVASNKGIVVMGLEGARLGTIANTNWDTWNGSPVLTGNKPTFFGNIYARTAAYKNYTAKSTDVAPTYYSPLASSYLSAASPYNPANGTAIQMSYADFGTAYSLYSSTGVNDLVNKLVFLGGAYNDAGYYPIVRQGQFLLYGFPVVANRPATGLIHFLNLVMYMRNQY